jgi:CDP-diacylglycerol--glycerol-3-phosphate 3-phosphatidyltransferase
MAVNKKENIWNIPNLLSAYRIAVFPYILFLIYIGRQEAYLIFFCINIVTDILDGAIARCFKLQTNFGARLDSIADVGSYILAGYGLMHFKWDTLSEVHSWIWIYVGAFIVPYIVSYLRFRKFPSLHLYSSKIGGALDGIFFFYLFFFGYNALLFTGAIVWGIASFIEMIAVLLLLKELRSDCKGLYWVMKKQ